MEDDVGSELGTWGLRRNVFPDRSQIPPYLAKYLVCRGQDTNAEVGFLDAKKRKVFPWDPSKV